jgi:hypothetical protein
MIGKLQRVPLREVWKHEALDFTRWLEENIDVLSDNLGLALLNVERERSAGTFSVDLVAEDEAGNAVIIENQLEKSDHDHLGKLITYLTVIGAKTAVWIVSEPRPEHINAITWLNEASAASFYLLKVEAVRIGDSPPAPLLTKIVGPSEEAREAGSVKKEMAERHVWRHDFWRALLDAAKGKTKLHANISPSRDSWISASAGISGLDLVYTALKHNAGVELYVDRGSEAENLSIFESLLADKAPIEEAFGGPLDWQRLDGKKACRIYHRVDLGGYRDQERWSEIQSEMIDAMIRLERALRPYLAQAAEATKTRVTIKAASSKGE